MKPRPYTYLGLAYARDGRLDEAAGYFSKAASLGSDTVETSCNKGVLFMKMKQFNRSITEFDNCLKQDPNSFDGYLGLADALIESGQAPRALQGLLAAAEHPAFQSSDKQAQILFKLGSLYANNGRLDKAESYLTQANKLDPENPYVINALGNVYLMNGWLREAANQYVRAVELKPDEPEPIYNAAIAFERLDRPDKAAEYYKKFIALNPEGYDDAMARANARTKGR
ncbi:MAG: tetratricopeptide repeat protein [Deltaproteobacteria bacterium]|nr:tetratricopeptide repeat protein [Deltaproteobacteria bacterium]